MPEDQVQASGLEKWRGVYAARLREELATELDPLVEELRKQEDLLEQGRARIRIVERELDSLREEREGIISGGVELVKSGVTPDLRRAGEIGIELEVKTQLQKQMLADFDHEPERRIKELEKEISERFLRIVRQVRSAEDRALDSDLWRFLFEDIQGRARGFSRALHEAMQSYGVAYAWSENYALRIEPKGLGTIWSDYHQTIARP